MVSKPTGRKKGRPSYVLSEDKERYVLTFFEAKHSFFEKEYSRSRISRTLVGLEFGLLDMTPENIERFVSGQKFRIVLRPGERIWRSDTASAEFNKKSIFDLMSDDRLHKIRRIKKDLSSINYRWFKEMTRAWRISLNSNLGTIEDLEQITAALDERKFCEQVLKPWHRASSGLGPVPELRLPDFIPHDAA